MTALDAADLVVIAARTLGIGNDAALAAMDVPAAQAALAEAGRGGREPGATPPDRDDAAAAGAELLRALLRHRPFAQRNQQVAVAAGLQLLSLRGWQADLNPAETAAVVVEALASGRLTAEAAATWLSPRLSPAPRAIPVRRAPATAPHPARAPRSPLRLARLLPEVPPRVGRVVAGVLFAGTVGGVTVLAAACSHAPGMTSTRTDSVRQTQPQPQPQPQPESRTQGRPQAQRPPQTRPLATAWQADQADQADAACMRSHSFSRFLVRPPSRVAAIALAARIDPAARIGPAAGIGPTSAWFRSAERACQPAVPAAVIHIVTTPAR